MKVRPTQPLLRTIPTPGAEALPQFANVVTQGQALERRGQRDEARALYESALHDDRVGTSADAAQLLRLISRAHLQDGDYAAADDCAGAALAVSEQTQDEAGRARAINMLASIQWNQGSHDAAQDLYLEARASAHRIGDARLAAMTASNLGVIATVRGDDGEALRYYETGLIDARGAGLVDESMIALVNLGQLHTHMSRFEEAGRSFSEAREIGTVIGDMGMLMRIELYFAKLHLKHGEQHQANAACIRSRALARQTGETFLDGDLEHVGLHGYGPRQFGC